MVCLLTTSSISSWITKHMFFPPSLIPPPAISKHPPPNTTCLKLIIVLLLRNFPPISVTWIVLDLQWVLNWVCFFQNTMMKLYIHTSKLCRSLWVLVTSWLIIFFASNVLSSLFYTHDTYIIVEEQLNSTVRLSTTYCIYIYYCW